jgi:uncharacterized membrane protein
MRVSAGFRRRTPVGGGMGFVDESIVVRADAHDAYSLWLDYEGYPRFMVGVEAVEVRGYCHLSWRARVCGELLEWETDVVARVEDTRLRWRATDGRETGDVDFHKLDVGETLVHYQLEYEPEAWGVDADGLRDYLHARVRDDLRAFRELAESPAVTPGVDERPT